VFAARTSAEQSLKRLFDLATRAVALVTLPTAAVFLAVFPSLAAVLLPDGYESTTDYTAILVPCFALEVVLSGPATALMLATPSLAGSYAVIKAVTLAVGAFYVVAAGVDLRLVTAVMMGTRLLSAVALHGAVWRRTRLHVDLRWLSLAIAIAVLVAMVGVGAGLAVPGRLPDLVVIPVTGLAAYLLLVRVAGLLRLSDVELARRLLPFGGGALRALSRA
jgi:hypothetical protein